MICAGAGERSPVCWECFINLPPPPCLNYFCQRAPGGGGGDREGDVAAVVELIPVCCSLLWLLLRRQELRGFNSVQLISEPGGGPVQVECLGYFSVVTSLEMCRVKAGCY